MGRIVEFLQDRNTLKEKIKNLPLRKRIRAMTVIMLRAALLGLLVGIILAVPACVATVWGIDFSYNLPTITIVSILSVCCIVLVIFCVLKFLPPKKMIKIIEDIDKSVK